MSDQELIAPLPLGEEDFADDPSDEDASSEEDQEKDTAGNSDDEIPRGQKSPLSTYLQVFRDTVAKFTPKKVKASIISIRAENPRVHQFEAGEKFYNVIREGFGSVTAKKLRAEWNNLRYKYLVEAELSDHTGVLGYVTSGKKNELAHLPVTSPERFVMVPSVNLSTFHSPDFDPAKHFGATRLDQRIETVTANLPGGSVRYKTINYDPRLILRAAQTSERAARPKVKVGSRVAAPAPADNEQDLGARICDVSRKLLMDLQAKAELCNVPVLVEQSPLFKELYNCLGHDRFPVLRSEDTDGLRLLPYDIGGDLGQMAECLKNLRAAQNGVLTEHLNGRWNTDPIVRALLVQSMCKQMCTLPATRLLRDSGKALSERNISGFMKDFVSTDRGCSFTADAMATMTTSRDIFSQLARLGHALLRTAAPLIAFANCAERLGVVQVQEFRFDSERMEHAPTLRCALSGSVIVPGMAFMLYCAKARPVEGQSAGRTMIAIVAKAVHDADMRLYPMQAPPKSAAKRAAAAVSFSPMSSIDSAPSAAKPKASRAVTRTPEETEARRIKKNERDKELRRLKKEAAAKEAKDPSPPLTPNPSPPKKAKKMKRTTSTEAVVPVKEPAKKKTKKNSGPDAVGGMKDYYGISPVLEQVGLVLEARALFQALGRFATSDPSVNQAMGVFLARTPTSYNPADAPSKVFKAWFPQNSAIFLQLASVFEMFTCKLANCTDDVKEAIAAAKAYAENGEASVAANDENSDADLLEGLTDEMREFMRGEGAEIPEKKKPAPPVSLHVVKPAPIRDDPLFAEFIKVAVKKPFVGSDFFGALAQLGPDSLSLDTMLEIIRRIPGTVDKLEVHKKTLGNHLAAFKWLFPTASQ